MSTSKSGYVCLAEISFQCLLVTSSLKKTCFFCQLLKETTCGGAHRCQYDANDATARKLKSLFYSSDMANIAEGHGFIVQTRANLTGANL